MPRKNASESTFRCPGDRLYLQSGCTFYLLLSWTFLASILDPDILDFHCVPLGSQVSCTTFGFCAVRRRALVGARLLGLSSCTSWQSGVLHNLWGFMLYVALPLLGVRLLGLSSCPSWQSGVLGNLWGCMLYVALPLLGVRHLGLSSCPSWQSGMP